MERFHNYKVLITGSSEGIGLGIAEAFALRGADVWLVARNQEKLQTARQRLAQYNVDIRLTAINLLDEGGSLHLAKEIAQQWSCLNVLVNNAARL